MGRASKAAEAYIAVLDRVVETLDDVLSRERGLSPILEMRDEVGNVIGGGSGREAGGITRSGASSTPGSGHGSLVHGRAHDRWLAGGAGGDLAAWRAYVRAANRAGLYGGKVWDFNEWKAAGRPSGFEYGGMIGGSGGSGSSLPGFDGPGGRFGTGGGGRFGTGGGGIFGRSSGSSVQVRDDATAAEVRGLRGDIRRNGGLL